MKNVKEEYWNDLKRSKCDTWTIGYISSSAGLFCFYHPCSGLCMIRDEVESSLNSVREFKLAVPKSLWLTAT
jgi:hypothetical protein